MIVSCGRRALRLCLWRVRAGENRMSSDFASMKYFPKGRFSPGVTTHRDRHRALAQL